MRLSGLKGLLDMVGAGTAEHDDIEKGVGTETVSTMHGHASSLARRVQAGNDLVLAVLNKR